MITSHNIGILLDLIKNSKKNSDLYLLVKKYSILYSSKRKSNFCIKTKNPHRSEGFCIMYVFIKLTQGMKRQLVVL